MPIYDQHYRLWEGRPRWRALRWSVITRNQIRQLFLRKGRIGLILLLVASAVTHLVFFARVYIMSNEALITFVGIPPKTLGTIDEVFFLRPINLGLQALLIGLISLIVGSGLIADDRRDNALPFYLSKPLTATEYLLGKFATLAFFILMMTVVPVNLLYLFHAIISGGMPFVREYWYIPFSITAFSLIITIFLGALMLMASSLVKKASVAGIIVIGLMIGLNAMAVFLHETFNNLKFFILAPQFDLQGIGLWLFGITNPEDYRLNAFVGVDTFSGSEALMVIAAIALVSWIVAWRRVRPVEVVK